MRRPGHLAIVVLAALPLACGKVRYADTGTFDDPSRDAGADGQVSAGSAGARGQGGRGNVGSGGRAGTAGSTGASGDTGAGGAAGALGVLGSTGKQKLTLILDDAHSGASGTVTFGDGPPPPLPTSASDAYPTSPAQWFDLDGKSWDVIRSNWIGWPASGFEYSIRASEIYGTQLVLAFAPIELWRPLCELRQFETQDPKEPFKICDCDGTTCKSLTAPIRRFDLAISGDTMAGELSPDPGTSFEEPIAIRLTRVR